MVIFSESWYAPITGEEKECNGAEKPKQPETSDEDKLLVPLVKKKWRRHL
jgi:hypothetical protein